MPALARLGNGLSLFRLRGRGTDANERALALAPDHVGLLDYRLKFLNALAEQEEKQGQMIALQVHIDQLLATYDALQAAIPATEVHAQRRCWCSA